MVSYEALKERPRIVVNDETNYLSLDGEGGEIPIFIVHSAESISDVENYTLPNGATVVIPKMELKTYTNGESILSALGDCEATDMIKEFFSESKIKNSTQLGVNKVYVINMSVWSDTTIFSQNVKNACILRALELSERARDGTMIVFNEPFTAKENNNTYTPDSVVLNYIGYAMSNVTKLRKKGQPRIAYFPAGTLHYGQALGEVVPIPAVAEFQALGKAVLNDNIVLIENCHYGALLGKIATTPYYVEPGKDALRTINEYETIKYGPKGHESTWVIPAFPVRSYEESTALMKAGILIGESDPYRVDSDGNSLQDILIGVSTGFAQEDGYQSTGCLLHALRNNNHQMREIMKLLAQQLKENETVDAISNLKLSVDNYLQSEQKAEHIKQYECNIYESDEDPYNLTINLSIAGINATYLIDYNNSIMEPKIITGF